MRPVHLTLQAFGSYPDREDVDFTGLADAGLFVVTGPTGSGKTTLFDAMAFALYGTVPGDRPDGDVRSHHAAPGMATEVTLTFEIDGERYRVFRTPKQMRPRRSGPGEREVPAAAELHRWTGAGWHPVETSVLRVGAACVELVGLRAEQFQKVVLLPQGRFAEFLLATSKNREELLRQLFGTAHIEKATQALVTRAKELHRQVASADTEVAHHRRTAVRALVQAGETLDGVLGRDTVQEMADARTASRAVERSTDDRGTPSGTGSNDRPAQASLFDQLTSDPVDDVPDAGDHDPRALVLDDDTPLPLLRRALDAAHRRSSLLAGLVEASAESAAVARATAARAADAAQRHDQHRQHNTTLARLLEEQADRERDAVALDAARRAAPVVTAQRALALCDRALLAAERAEADIHARTVELLEAAGGAVPAGPAEALGAASALSAAVDAARQSLRHLEEVSGAVEAALAVAETARRQEEAIAEAVEALTTQCTAIRQAIDDCQALAESAPARLAALDDARQTLDLAERRDAAAVRLDAAATQAARAEREEAALVAAFAATAAPRLAATLVEGDPCPVCGSCEHPAPAGDDPDAVVVDQAALDAARAATNAAHAERSQALGVLAELAALLGDDAQATTDVLVARVTAAERAATEAADAQARQRAAVDELAAAERLLAQRGEERTQTAEDVARTAGRLEELQPLLAEAITRAEGLDADTLAERERLAEAVRLAAEQWLAASGDKERCIGERTACAAAAEDALAASGFDDPSRADDAFASAEDVRRLDARVSQWRSRLEATRSALAVLAEQDVPAQRPDADARAAEAAAADATAQALARSQAQVEQWLGTAREAIDTTEALGDDSSAVRAEAELVDRVARVCSAQVAPRISLETWVLARELDRVASAANVHLQRMTASRYTLHTVSSAPEADQRRRVGLDLVVLDAHTGRERSPRTLSGGEQFQASLALALGMADVVSQGGSGSGKVYEALFVDEGFGSLDPDALDDAIAALSHLQAGGRMVGIITHVEAMKQQLRTGISVERLPDGRGSTIRCA